MGRKLRILVPVLLGAGMLVVLLAVLIGRKSPDVENANNRWASMKPTDWMMLQRLYPHGDINPDAYERYRQQSVSIRRDALRSKSGEEEWEMVGPYNIGGRITDVEMHPEDLQTIYACAASGGVYKSTDQGKIWTQIFENEYTLSTGDMGIARTNKNILYLGTGEPNGGQGSITYDGYGVFKSIDGGENWSHSGLENAGGIGRVEVDPTNADRVFVAAMGNLFAKNPQRGVFRTLDGGTTWENVLFISDSTGAIDLCINPQNPNIIYAAMWERVRFVHRRTYGGPTSGIYRSTDGGDSWTHLTQGLPNNNLGRIGIDISMSHPNVLYAVYANDDGTWKDAYKTIDGGSSWTALGANLNQTTYYWWFGKVQIHPTNPDIVWSVDFDLHKSVDGGRSWRRVPGLHVDQHGVYSHPLNPDFVVTGNDGGVYLSTDGTTTNKFVNSLPITQFYTCEVNYQRPEQKMGGTQDNGTVRTLTGETYDWQTIYGGDGFVIRVDPSDDRYVYASSQRGGFGRSTNGGSSFQGGKNGITGSNRWNWKTPYVLDPKDPKILYIGSQQVWKSTNRAVSWSRISDDLTNGEQEWNYGTLTSLAVSPVDSKVIWAGTDDGNVWVSINGGSGMNWTRVSDLLPERWVTWITADPFDAGSAYVSYSGIYHYDYQPHVFKTVNYGETWEDISGNLPDLPVNCLVADPDFPGTLYIATDDGVFVTMDGGGVWEVFGSGMPTVPVLEINLHRPTRTLLAATFGRSMYRIPLKASSGTGDLAYREFMLKVFPNPARETVDIVFNLRTASEGTLLVMDMSGRVIEVIREGLFMQGENRFQWQPKAGAGQYIIRLVSTEGVLASRVQVIN